MLDPILEGFSIRPDADLDLMRPGQSLSELTARAVAALDAYLVHAKPDMVLIQGDTTTVLCAALAAFYRHIPIGHIEAGLRTGNLDAPWPEEANRVLTSRLATRHFAPTETARQNLIREAVPADRILVTGNTVIDALLVAIKSVRENPPFIPVLPEILQPARGCVRDQNPTQQPPDTVPAIVLITGHRRENLGEGFDSICHAISELAHRHPSVHFVYPVHLNPKVREPVRRILAIHGNSGRNIHLIEPLPYHSFVALMMRAAVILTDSGGVQEEAPSLGKPVLVMRKLTERPEAIATGTATLIGTNRGQIVSAVSQLLDRTERVDTVGLDLDASEPRPNPYGDGNAAGRIVAACVEYLAGHPVSK